MLLKNLMADKQLNFDQPLLSVRRSSSIVASNKHDGRRTDNILPSIPRLPFYKSELKSGPVRNPGSIPFVWEQSPGRPKDEGKLQTDAIEGHLASPNPPPGRILKPEQKDSDKISEDSNVHIYHAAKVSFGLQNASYPCLNKNETKFESSKDRVEENSDSGDGDDTYLDALDTLSKAESFCLNHSVSGLSGFDGPDIKPSGIFSTDPQTRDLIMGRFLPAAKAMASETPQYAPWRTPVVQEQPRQIKVVSKKCPPLQYGPNIVSHYVQDNESGDESDDEFDEPGRLSAKVCGLLPRFCLKNSFSLLNPVPGMSMRTQIPMSSVRGRQTRSSSAGSSTVTKNECSRIGYSGQTQVGELQTGVIHENKRVLKNGADWNSTRKLKGSSAYRHLQSNSMSPLHNKLPQSTSHEQSHFLCRPQVGENAGVSEVISLKRNANSFPDFVDHNGNIDIASASPIVEKTLYVDIVHKVESPKPNASFLPTVHSSLKDEENLNIVGKANLQPNVQKPFQSVVPSSAAKSNQEVGLDPVKGFRQNEDLYQDSIFLANYRSPDNLDCEVQRSQKAKTSENSHGVHAEFSVPPPLPKSPSDSWLCRTLGSMPSRNLSSRSYLGAESNRRIQGSRTSSDAKFPTTIKTTRALMRPIPED